MRRLWAIRVMLILLCLAAFGPAIGADFVNFDDNLYVTENPRVLAGLSASNLAWAMTSFDATNWHPLTWISLLIDTTIWGRNPMGFHLTSLLIHCVNALLLLEFLRRFAVPMSLATAAAAAAIWAIHPLRVESVAWIAERKDVLSMCFGLLAMLAYCRGMTRNRPARAIGWSAVFMALSLMSKPLFVTLPLLLLLLDHWPLDRWPKASPLGIFAEKAPLFALAIADSLVTIAAQRTGGAIQTLQAVSLDARIANALVSVMRYLEKSVRFDELAVWYPRLPWTWLEIIGSTAVIAAVTFWAWRLRRRRPWLLVGWLFFGIALLPMIGLVQVGSQAMADRYAYLPSVGLVLAAVGFIGPRFTALHAGAAVIIAGICGFHAHRQAGYWQDSRTLFTRAIQVSPDIALAENNLGVVSMEEKDYQQAISRFTRAAELAPWRVDYVFNLGNALSDNGDWDAAVKEYEKAIRMRPDYVAAHHNLGMLLLRQDKLDESAAHFLYCLKNNPDDPLAHYYMGKILIRKNRPLEAANHLAKALQVQPAFRHANALIGVCLRKLGRTSDAITAFKRELALYPDDQEARTHLLELEHAARNGGRP